jgi:tetratricopeptide (TPR) repeat protein
MRIKLSNLIWLAILVSLPLALYLPGLNYPLLFDDRLLSSGDLFAQYGALLDLKPRLLSYGSFVWVQDAFGTGWWKQRLVNLALHAAVILALWGFYREILRFIQPTEAHGGGTHPSAAYHESPALILAIGCFALNPVAVYAVAYLIQRSILMATLFVVLALWLFARGLATGKLWPYLASLLCYALAVLAKEHAMMAPLAALPVYILVARPAGRKLAVIGLAGAVLVALVGGLLAMHYGAIIAQPFDEHSKVYLAQLAALGGDVERNAYPLSLVNQSYLFFKYGLYWLVPYEGWMSIDMRPPFPLSLLTWPQTLGVLGYLAVLIGAMWLLIRRRDGLALVGLALLLPALLFATEFITVWVQDPFVLYRSYLWAIGIPGLVFFACHGLPSRALLVLGVVLAMLFGWQGWERVHSMSSPERVWSDAIAKLPDDARAVGRWFPYLNRAEDYLARDKLNDAYRDFLASSSLGDRGLGKYNIGAMLGMVGKYPESLSALDEAVAQGYDGFGVAYQRGVALHGLGRVPEAYAAFKSDLAKAPPEMRVRILAAMGKSAMAMGKGAEALAHLTEARSLAPGSAAIEAELGMAYIVAGEHQKAYALFDGLLKTSPTAPVYYGRALASYGLKQKSQALADIEAALRLAPDNPGLLPWRAKIQAMP